VPSFSYKLKSLQGITSRGVVAADTLEGARALLSTHDAVLIALNPVRIGAHFFQKPAFFPKELLTLFKPLSQLCRAGLSLLDALKALSSQGNSKSYQSIIRLLENGLPLSQALENSALLQNPLLSTFLRQGERNGDYLRAFDQITEHLQWLEDLKKRLKKTLSYPALDLLLSLSLMFFLMGFMVPQLLDLYTMNNLEVPPMTQALMTFSDAIPFVLGSLIILIVLMSGLFLSAFIYGRHRDFFLKNILHTSLRIPLIGPLLKEVLLLQYIKNMHALLATQQDDILRSMSCAENSLSPKVFKEIFQAPPKSVEQRRPLSLALHSHLHLPEALFRTIEVGETSGTLPRALNHVASYINTNLQERLNTFIQRLGPLMLLCVGGLLIFIISAVFLPLYSGLGGLGI